MSKVIQCDRCLNIIAAADDAWRVNLPDINDEEDLCHSCLIFLRSFMDGEAIDGLNR